MKREDKVKEIGKVDVKRISTKIDQKLVSQYKSLFKGISTIPFCFNTISRVSSAKC